MSVFFVSQGVGRERSVSITSRGLPVDGDAPRITAKSLDVVAHPLDRQPLVSEPGILRSLGLELCGLSKAED